MALVLLIAIPALGGVLALASGRFGAAAPRRIALASMGLALALSVWIWFENAAVLAIGGTHPSWALEVRASWIPTLGASFHLGLDGLSLVLVVLTNLLGLFAVLCGWREVEHDPGLFHFNLLWNLAGVVGVFLALDLLLFFFFWEVMLVPMYFLIALWGRDVAGGRTRGYAAVKFFIFTQASGLLLLVSILALALVHFRATHVVSFDYADLLATPMASGTEWWLALGFFLAFAIKLPIVPLHTWLPDAHCNAPTSGSVDLAGLLLKSAAYGLLRFALPFFPHASAAIAPIAMWLGVAGIVYGALVAFAQTDLKRLVAYTGVSHLGFVVVGIYAGTEQALLGVVVQMVAHGISAGALFVLSGEIQARFGTRDLRELGGLWARMPRLPPIVLFFALASLGLPGLGNFVGEFLILSGTFTVAPAVAIAATSGLVLSVAYALIVVQRALHGPVGGAVRNVGGAVAELTRPELAMLASLVVLLIGLGLYPQPVLDAAKAPMTALHAAYRPAPLARVHLPEPPP